MEDEFPKVVVLSTDFKLYYLLKTYLGNSPYRLIHTLELPKENSNAIIVRSTSDLKLVLGFPTITLDPNHLSKSIVMSELSIILSGITSGEYVIGVDPGKTIGISFHHNEDMLNSIVVDSPEKAVTWIGAQIKGLKIHSLKIKIGNGGGEVRESLVDLVLKTYGQKAVIMDVNENNTSIGKNRYRTEHEIAASEIATRDGRVINNSR